MGILLGKFDGVEDDTKEGKSESFVLGSKDGVELGIVEGSDEGDPDGELDLSLDGVDDGDGERVEETTLKVTI